ncbi:WhiB family transcriptional regulator [Planomonospora sp. ID82291]|uniref:WhiB family transcriptional regulator n=1 Tax=Planomonospora sp. ID82291 TaxID=2738136 RepID=UPI0018C4262D|nr:WhiB family transcriptional regulator [Planomonospora sp. ID82291]MBG0813513.1 WhiB family transcriptional regulator [Planomonospora sp. ID82291]
MRRTVREIGWAVRGACRESDPELFFPVAPSPEQEERAKAVCAGCPVLADCRAYAVRVGEPEGIWGGLTVRERRGLRFPPGWRRAAG